MVLELARPEVKSEPGLQGSYEKEFVALEASVKDGRRFEGGKLKAKAAPFPQASCWACHHEKAERCDHVFTQFYPVLRAVSPKGS